MTGPSQFDPARYGTITIRVDRTNITDTEYARISEGVERSRAIGPNFTLVTTQADIEIRRSTSGGCAIDYSRASQVITIYGTCFEPITSDPIALQKVVMRALARWTTPVVICRDGQTPDSACSPCSSIGRGIAALNSSCYSGAGTEFTDSINPMDFTFTGFTQLDLDAFRASHP